MKFWGVDFLQGGQVASRSPLQPELFHGHVDTAFPAAALLLDAI